MSLILSTDDRHAANFSSSIDAPATSVEAGRNAQYCMPNLRKPDFNKGKEGCLQKFTNHAVQVGVVVVKISAYSSEALVQDWAGLAGPLIMGL